MDAPSQLAAEISARLIDPLVALNIGGGKPPSPERLIRRCGAMTNYLDYANGTKDGGRDISHAIIVALFGEGWPPSAWWSTPLGLLCAANLPTTMARTGIPQSEAAEILGVHKGTVTQLVARGTLPKSADGGISLAAVLARLVRLAT